MFSHLNNAKKEAMLNYKNIITTKESFEDIPIDESILKPKSKMRYKDKDKEKEQENEGEYKSL